MSWDIHTHLEIKRDSYAGKNVNGEPISEEKWTCADYLKFNEYYGYEDEPEYDFVEICNGSYRLFAVLANVGNDNDFPFLSEPRGLPDDVTEMVKQDSDKWGVDGHSHSYFTLAELIDWSERFEILIPLIEKIKQRANELRFIYDLAWEREPETALKDAENVRLVFWFDN